MKKGYRIVGVVGLLMLACIMEAQADTATILCSATGTAEYSSAIPVSGFLERIEFLYTGHTNNVFTVDVATFEGTTAMTTFADLTINSGTNTSVVYPRFLPTDNTGAALAASYAVGAGTNGVVQALNVNYERHIIGGNVKLKVGASAGTNATVKATIFYERSPY